jgi:hypothetical protein
MFSVDNLDKFNFVFQQVYFCTLDQQPKPYLTWICILSSQLSFLLG